MHQNPRRWMLLHIFSRDVTQRIKSGDRSWEKMVPLEIVELSNSGVSSAARKRNRSRSLWRSAVPLEMVRSC
jgi:hypothetical protein